jgi:hypothetical protein
MDSSQADSKPYTGKTHGKVFTRCHMREIFGLPRKLKANALQLGFGYRAGDNGRHIVVVSEPFTSFHESTQGFLGGISTRGSRSSFASIPKHLEFKPLWQFAGG